MILYISVPIILRNIVRLNYPVEMVVGSVAGLANEVVLCVDPSSEDSTVKLCEEMSLRSKLGGIKTDIRVVYSKWDLKNITDTGYEFAKQTNIAIDYCIGDWVLLLQADEAIHEQDFDKILDAIDYANDNNIDGYEMTRLYFYGSMDVIRDDWTVPIIRLFKKGSRKSCGDAMNTLGKGRVERLNVPIYHYSRIGDPEIISKRILSLDKFFHRAEKLKDEKELKPYSFDTYNFDCQHKDNIDIGRKKVEQSFSTFTGTHPKIFVGYTGEGF